MIKIMFRKLLFVYGIKTTLNITLNNHESQVINLYTHCESAVLYITMI